MVKKIGVISLTLMILMGCTAASCKEIPYTQGEKIILHNNSPWYIIEDRWLENENATELQNGVLFISVSDFGKVLRCPINYNYGDCSIYVNHKGREIWQGLNTPVMFVDHKPYPNPAPYISSTGEVMIPLEQYASVFGYKGEMTYPEDYKPGRFTLTLSPQMATISYIEVNKAMQMVIVYAQDSLGTLFPIRHFICSTGIPLDQTPNGTFSARPLTYTSKHGPWYYFQLHDCWVIYCTQISGDICFHSVTFNEYDAGSLSKTAYQNLGNPASHGCIRLMVEDAEFIWENCKNVKTIISDGFYDDGLANIKKGILLNKFSYDSYLEAIKADY
ncbi:MAG: L,D-transpeptidase [Clostridia bacterium]|nr:L,D-transpeptidase [Clostridia bacterium]